MFPISREALSEEVARRAGCLELRRARSTGLVVGLYDGREAGFDVGGPDDEEWPWSTVCEDHSTVLQHRTRRLAEAHLSHPDEWCDECRERLERRRERGR